MWEASLATKATSELGQPSAMRCLSWKEGSQSSRSGRPHRQQEASPCKDCLATSQLTAALSLARYDHHPPNPTSQPYWKQSLSYFRPLSSFSKFPWESLSRGVILDINAIDFHWGVGGRGRQETLGRVRIEKRTTGGVGTSNYF